VAKLRIHIDVPAPGNRTVSTLLGLVGVLGVPVSVGGLVGNWWWSGLVASVLALGVAAVAQYNGAAEDLDEPVDHGPATAPNPPAPRPRFGMLDEVG